MLTRALLIAAVLAANPAAVPEQAAGPVFLNINPSWSPDSRRVAFDSNHDGNGEIYLVDADGGNLRRITDMPAARGTRRGRPTADSCSRASATAIATCGSWMPMDET